MKIHVETDGQEAMALDRALRHHAEGRAERPDTKETVRSLDVVLSVLTDRRLELLRLIREHRPASVYQLAKLADRDRKAVTEDVNLLLFNGFLKAERVRGRGRARNVLSVPFRRIQLVLDLD